jgi:type IV pilus assembly protein PilW
MLNPVRTPKYNISSQGFSLIELMLAMVIGLIIIGGVMSLYISTRNTQRVSEDQLQLISDARFVINTISDDMRLAAYWGPASVTSSIRCTKKDSDPANTGATCTGSGALPLATGDCEDSWYIDLDNNAISASDNSSNYTNTCTTQNYKAGTDVLGVHYADPVTIQSYPTNLLAANVTYIRSNYDVGALFIGSVIPTTGAYSGLNLWGNTLANKDVTQNRKLVANVYYVSNDSDSVVGVPSLHRVELTPGPVMTDNMLLSGVADLQFEYGIDTDDDGSADTDVNASSLASALLNAKGQTDWSRLLSVKIWVLMRSPRVDRDLPAGAQTFTLGNKGAITYNDGHRYYMVSSVVNLRNPKF